MQFFSAESLPVPLGEGETVGRLLAITWGALRMIVIGPSEPGSEADGSRRPKASRAQPTGEKAGTP